MRIHKAMTVVVLPMALGLGVFACQSPTNDAGDDSPVDTRRDRATTTVLTTSSPPVSVTMAPRVPTSSTSEASPSTNADPGHPSAAGTLPTNLVIPSGMALTDGPVTTGGHTSATLSCSGRASSALTDLTTMLNTGGYRTKWTFKGPEDPVQTAILDGSAKDLKVRAIIDDDAGGNCRQVHIEFSRP